MKIHDILQYLIWNYLEIIGFVAAMIYLYFSIKQNIWLWPLGIITSLAYILLFYQQKIYGYAALNGYYVIISIYGWHLWWRNAKKSENTQMPDLPLHATRLLQIIFVGLILWFIFYLILSRLTDSVIPIGDSFTTAFSVVATWMLARKYLENWILWIVIDSIAAVLYWYQEMLLTTLLYLVYAVMAVIGYFQWVRSMKKDSVAS